MFHSKVPQGFSFCERSLCMSLFDGALTNGPQNVKSAERAAETSDCWTNHVDAWFVGAVTFKEGVAEEEQKRERERGRERGVAWL